MWNFYVEKFIFIFFTVCKKIFDKTKQNCIFIRIEDTFK